MMEVRSEDGTGSRGVDMYSKWCGTPAVPTYPVLPLPFSLSDQWACQLGASE